MEVGNIYTFKLNSGEEFIAKVIQNTGHESLVTISEPVSIAPANKGIQMIPSIFTGVPGGVVTLNTSSVTMYTETEDSIKDKYIEATTGIKLPEKKIILG